jgi:hypothetical protein
LQEEQDCVVERPIGANLRAALEDKGWSYTRLIAEMRRVAARERVTLPTARSLVVMLSRWCNDQERPSDFYQAILSKALGCSPAADAHVLLGNHIQHADERSAHLLCYGGRLRWATRHWVFELPAG